jgi:hypothetical protein
LNAEFLGCKIPAVRLPVQLSFDPPVDCADDKPRKSVDSRNEWMRTRIEVLREMEWAFAGPVDLADSLHHLQIVWSKEREKQYSDGPSRSGFARAIVATRWRWYPKDISSAYNAGFALSDVLGGAIGSWGIYPTCLSMSGTKPIRSGRAGSRQNPRSRLQVDGHMTETGNGWPAWHAV